jgi:hypothetical protein
MPKYLAGSYGSDWRDFVKGRSPLNQETVDRFPCRSFVVAGEDHEFVDGFPRLQIGRIWMLLPGATLERLPAKERLAAHSVLRCGQAVLLLAPDRRTEELIRKSLLALLDADDARDGQSGHA